MTFNPFSSEVSLRVDIQAYTQELEAFYLVWHDGHILNSWIQQARLVCRYQHQLYISAAYFGTGTSLFTFFASLHRRFFCKAPSPPPTSLLPPIAWQYGLLSSPPTRLHRTRAHGALNDSITTGRCWVKENTPHHLTICSPNPHVCHMEGFAEAGMEYTEWRRRSSMGEEALCHTLHVLSPFTEVCHCKTEHCSHVPMFCFVITPCRTLLIIVLILDSVSETLQRNASPPPCCRTWRRTPRTNPPSTLTGTLPPSVHCHCAFWCSLQCNSSLSQQLLYKHCVQES